MPTEVIIMCSYGLCTETAAERGGVIGGPVFDLCPKHAAEYRATAAGAGVPLKLEPIPAGETRTASEAMR
jgi:hypothetical protein